MPLWVMLMLLLLMMMMLFWLLFPRNIPGVFLNYKNCFGFFGFWFEVWTSWGLGLLSFIHSFFLSSSHIIIIIMAQLPPKVPTMAAPNWPSFPHQKIPSMGSLAPPASQNPTWVDEFLDFSSAKRGTHRRSASDSIAFFEAPDECRNSGAAAAAAQPPGSVNEFDRFDDEQLMSMFSDAIAPTVSSSNPSTPSDHYSFDEDQKTTTIEQKQQQQNQQHQHQHHPKNESEEVESICKSEQLQQPSNTTSNDRIIDPKRVKRWDLPSFSSVMQLHTTP